MDNTIKIYRIETDYDPDRLAYDVGLSGCQELFDIESGKKEIDVATMAKFVQALKIPAGKLFPIFSLSNDKMRYRSRNHEILIAKTVLQQMKTDLDLMYTREDKDLDYLTTKAAIETALKCMNQVRYGIYDC